MFICLPQGIQDVGDFVSSVEPNEDFKAMGPIDCHYMTDRLQRFELKIFVRFYWRNKVTYILDALGVSR